jgi:hypothetical protein
MDRPPVEDSRPPTAVLRYVNPVLIALLRSRLHRLASKNLMVLSVTGRRSGRTLTMPVTRHEQPDGTLVVAAAGAWRHNLQDGAEVRVTVGGLEQRAHVTPERDPGRAAQVFKDLLERAGSRAVGVKVNVDRSPTVEEIEPLLAHRVIAYLQRDG